MTRVSGKRDQALAFISEYIVREGRSPAIGEIAVALGVGLSRAKALVKKLAEEKMINRAPGSQRAITVPGLMDRHIEQRMREMGGFVINGDFICPLKTLPFPKGHLPLVAIIDHIPATKGNIDDNFDE
jgi:SOS-response transcriptional repressor LexA